MVCTWSRVDATQLAPVVVVVGGIVVVVVGAIVVVGAAVDVGLACVVDVGAAVVAGGVVVTAPGLLEDGVVLAGSLPTGLRDVVGVVELGMLVINDVDALSAAVAVVEVRTRGAPGSSTGASELGTVDAGRTRCDGLCALFTIGSAFAAIAPVMNTMEPLDATVHQRAARRAGRAMCSARRDPSSRIRASRSSNTPPHQLQGLLGVSAYEPENCTPNTRQVNDGIH